MKKVTLPESLKLIEFKDSYSRLPAIFQLRSRMDEIDWWTLLGREWTTCDNVYQWKMDLDFAFSSATTGHLHAMMNEVEQQYLSLMEEEFTVFRGCYARNKDGYSWSTDREIALAYHIYARYRLPGGTPLLLIGQAPRARSVLKLGRNENEIICGHVKILREEIVTEK